MSSTDEKVSYPNGFLFGAITGIILQQKVRKYSHSKLSSKPIGYIRSALLMGTFFWYYNYWRRCALEGCLEREEKQRLTKHLQFMNRIKGNSTTNYFYIKPLNQNRRGRRNSQPNWISRHSNSKINRSKFNKQELL